jgi:hypothetical protein
MKPILIRMALQYASLKVLLPSRINLCDVSKLIDIWPSF